MIKVILGFGILGYCIIRLTAYGVMAAKEKNITGAVSLFVLILLVTGINIVEMMI